MPSALDAGKLRNKIDVHRRVGSKCPFCAGQVKFHLIKKTAILLVTLLVVMLRQQIPQGK